MSQNLVQNIDKINAGLLNGVALVGGISALVSTLLGLVARWRSEGKDFEADALEAAVAEYNASLTALQDKLAEYWALPSRDDVEPE